jgi:hypothetical protein
MFFYIYMNTLDHLKLNSAGWFIPPYVTVNVLNQLSTEILSRGDLFSQKDLEIWLARIYSPNYLAAMVSERYCITPFVKDYTIIIAEAVEAHFLGLNHIAVSGLMPVIEGAGKKLASSRNVSYNSITEVFVKLANDCKAEVTKNQIGVVHEIISMMDSFIDFTKNHLYVNSGDYPLTDKTNRHGILHGAFADADYGEPINFYKIIAAVDFLCFIAALRATISWLPPSWTEQSLKISDYYKNCISLSQINPCTANKLLTLLTR